MDRLRLEWQLCKASSLHPLSPAPADDLQQAPSTAAGLALPKIHRTRWLGN